MQTLQIGSNQAGQRLDKYLHKVMPNAGTGFLYKMLRKKNITLNGKKAEGSEMLNTGDTVSFFFAEETFLKFAGESVASNSESATGKDPYADYRKAYGSLKGITVLYEDDDFCFLVKPAGILSQKAEPKDISINEWLIGYLLESDKKWEEELRLFHPSICNRLDRNTSGLILCGKSLAGSQYLSKCIKERTVRKFYRTICVGKINEASSVEGYLCKDNAKNKVTVRKSAAAGEQDSYIKTAYKPMSVGKNYTHLEVELITGKTHQIRAHLSSLGHPIIGDFKYGNQNINQNLKKAYQLSFQLLHAYRVEFPACTEGVGASLSQKTFVAPYPKLFTRLLHELSLNED